MMTLTRFLMSTGIAAVMMVAGAASFAADAPPPMPQVLGAPTQTAASPQTVQPGMAQPGTNQPGVAPMPGEQVPTSPDAPPAAPAGAVTEAPAASTPDNAALASPGDATAMPPQPNPTATATAVAGAALPSPDMMEQVSGDSTVNAIVPNDKKSDQPDAYYDSRLNVPTGPLANTVGPRKVDPIQEPGSKYVIAKKNHSASDTESLLVAASRALDLDRNDAALEMYDDLYKKNPRDPRILMGRAVAQQKLGQDDLAIVSYQTLLDIDPKNSDAIVNMMGLIRKQYPAVALRRLSDLQNKFPGNAGIVAQLGMTYAQMGDNKEAIKALGMAASMEPNNAQHAFNMAVIFDRSGDKTNAMRYYEEALQTDAVYGGSHSIPREKVYDRLAKLRQ